MAPVFLQRLEIREFGCVKRAMLELSPLHAFVGPNDSGKSTLLEAVTLAMAGGTTAKSRSTTTLIPLASNGVQGPLLAQDGPPTARLRLDPDQLREASALLAPDRPLALATERGRGLPAFIDALRDRSEAAYAALTAAFLDLFPLVASLQLQRLSSSQKIVQVKLKSGEEIPASQMSEGMLYALAFLAMEHADRPAIFLVEEPENGLHPSYIAEVMRVLRRISETTQVLIATHSPLVLNELEGHEASVVTRTAAEGTRVVRLDRTFNYAERAKVYRNGELWLAHCDGKTERELLEGPGDT